MMQLPKRKRMRLSEYDYSTPGYYFITVCTKDRRKILGKIVGTGLPDGPVNELSDYGKVVRKQIETMRDFYDYIRVEKYVIMPNHIHMLIYLPGNFEPETWTAKANSAISKFVGTFKRFCNRAYGEDIWQSRSYDHVVRGARDYEEIWRYIEDNPRKWMQDSLYEE